MVERDQMRASDADRTKIADQLRRATDEGRLLAHEFDERLGQALNARTYGELDALVADLPPEQAPATRTETTPSRRRPALIATTAGAAAAAAAAAVILLAPFSGTRVRAPSSGVAQAPVPSAVAGARTGNGVYTFPAPAARPPKPGPAATPPR
jgi:Domain of unknown function (DUF1707)